MSGTLTTGKLILTQNTSNNDAFDRLRVSNVETLCDLNHIYHKNPFEISEYVSTTGATSNHISTNSYVQMALTNGGVTGKVIRQSNEYIPHQSGKSKLMMFSGVMEFVSGGTTGVFARIGCFDSSEDKLAPATGTGNGCFFELNNKTLYVVIRNNNDDTLKVAQNNWNYDTFNGLGPSGITLNDYSKSLLYVIDQESNGVGTVRFGLYFNGKMCLAHIFNNSGITVPYNKTPKLPIRYEISSTIPATAEMRMICSSIISEGGFEPSGLSFSIGRPTVKSITSTTTPIPIIAVKLRDSEPFNRKTMILKSLSILNTSKNTFQWDLYVLPDETDLQGGSWLNINDANSIAQYNNNPTSITQAGAVLIESGYSTDTSYVSFKNEKYLGSIILNSNISGKSKVMCLCGVSLGGTITTVGSLSWIEII